MTEITNMQEFKDVKCIYCEKQASPTVTLVLYPNGKVAHYTCHIENNE